MQITGICLLGAGCIGEKTARSTGIRLSGVKDTVIGSLNKMAKKILVVPLIFFSSNLPSGNQTWAGKSTN